jgi:hypothetical protein
VGRRHDAVLALAVLVPALAGALALAPPAPGPLAAGAVVALLAEAATLRVRERVRRLWERAAVQVLATVALAAAATAGVVLVGAAAAWAVVGGLLAYLGVLATVAALARRREQP